MKDMCVFRICLHLRKSLQPTLWKLDLETNWQGWNLTSKAAGRLTVLCDTPSGGWIGSSSISNKDVNYCSIHGEPAPANWWFIDILQSTAGDI